MVPSRPGLVSDVVKAEVMENHESPIVVLQLCVNVSSDVVVHFGEVLSSVSKHGQRSSLEATDCDEEARGAIVTIKRFGKQFEPSVVAIHEQLSRLFSLDLRKPGILGGEARRGIGLVNVEDEINKGRDGAGSDGFDPRHCHSGRAGVGCEGYGFAISDKTEGVSRTSRLACEIATNLCVNAKPELSE